MNLETKREKQKALLSNEENCLPFLNGDRFVLERQRQVSSGESNASRSRWQLLAVLNSLMLINEDSDIYIYISASSEEPVAKTRERNPAIWKQQQAVTAAGHVTSSPSPFTAEEDRIIIIVEGRAKKKKKSRDDMSGELQGWWTSISSLGVILRLSQASDPWGVSACEQDASESEVEGCR